MRRLRKRRRIHLAVTAAALLAAAAALVGYGFRDGIAYFRLPSDIAAEPPDASELFRLGGLVAAGSVVRRGNSVQFDVEDDHHSVRVSFDGILPDLFAEGQGVIVLGRYRDRIFTATEVLAKHDESYMPKEVADALKEQGLFQSPDS